MHASTQENFKHAVPPRRAIDAFHASTGRSVARINITYRFYRPDFLPHTTPKCHCNLPCILRPDMKNRYEALPAGDASADSSDREGWANRSLAARYWWTCYAGAQNDGHGCGYWKVMDVKAEGRGPFVEDISAYTTKE